MKPFNLKLAKQGHPVCTRDGRDVRILCFDRMDPQYCIVALVKNNVFEKLQIYTSNGRLTDDTTYDLDLVMKAEKREGWINIYGRDGINSASMTVYKTRKEAFKNRTENGYKDTIKIEWEQ